MADGSSRLSDVMQMCPIQAAEVRCLVLLAGLVEEPRLMKLRSQRVKQGL